MNYPCVCGNTVLGFCILFLGNIKINTYYLVYYGLWQYQISPHCEPHSTRIRVRVSSVSRWISYRHDVC